VQTKGKSSPAVVLSRFYRSINLIPSRFLADGRPVFSRLVNLFTRFDPRFNNILMVESAAVGFSLSIILPATPYLSP